MWKIKKRFHVGGSKAPVSDTRELPPSPPLQSSPLQLISSNVSSNVSSDDQHGQIPFIDSKGGERRRESQTFEPPKRIISSSPPNTVVGAHFTFNLPQRSLTRSSDRSQDPLGLILVHEPETAPTLDIIFVHGLGGSSRGTWAKNRDLEYFWPGKWLSVEPGISNARILSFGYDANIASTGPPSIAGILDFAKDLLFSMKYAKNSKLDELELGQRPIIFICHSMGGLVTKQAYILGQQDRKYSEIISSICAILFLATPHRGSNLAETLNRILQVSIFNHSPKVYISELSAGSQTIQNLNEQFQHAAPKLDIFSFYETLQTSIGGIKKMMVVEKYSATLGHPAEISKPLNADHHTVCKFDSTVDSNYVSVRNALKTVVTAIRSTGRHIIGGQSKTELEQLKSLLGVSGSHQDDLEWFRTRWTSGTCEWILSHQKFNDWVDQNQGTKMLWLHALPASGKSVLSFYITQHLLQESFCAYHFFRFGDQSKRSLSTCLRTIAFQIATQLPQFRRALKDTRFATKTLEKADAQTVWEKVFLEILFRMSLTTTMYWVIDALDESDNPRLLIEMMQYISDSQAPIKLLLVSRQTTELIETFDRISAAIPVVYLPVEETKKDIRVLVESEVQYMRASLQFRAQVVERLVIGAGGNFLWASLALAAVMACNTNIDETLRAIPSGMENLYHRMERMIIEKAGNPQDLSLGQTILTWAVCSQRPLVLTELTTALKLDFDLVELDTRFLISRVCGQFVVVDTLDQLSMIHQTARDHIIATKSPLAVKLPEGHGICFERCLAVLEVKHKPREMDRRPSHQKSLEPRDFVRYAMTSWAYHLNLLSSESDEPLRLLVKFLKGTSVLAWIAVLARENRLQVLVSSSKNMSTYVRRKREWYADKNPMLRESDNLDIVDSWATDFLKIVGKFGQNLSISPSAIYQQIPPFCPKNSTIYQQFKPQSQSLSVRGLSSQDWDDNLARLSLGSMVQTLFVACTGDHLAVVTAKGRIVLYNPTTFEVKRTLEHRERVCAMRFSSCGNLLATYGYRTTKVWSTTGQIMNEIQNPRGSQALTIRFSTRNTKIVVGSNDCLIRVADLKDRHPQWTVPHPSLLKGDTAIDRPVHSVPWRIAFNAEADAVAVSYRGAPMTVWSLDPPELVGRCMRSRDYAGNSWSVVDQVVWHPDSEEVLGIYFGGHVVRWNPYDNTHQETGADAAMLAVSQDGRFFATGGTNGTIKLYNFHHFTLIYQLSCENMIADICFSPESSRIYDIRGQFCNVWEPNALLRLEAGSEHDNETASEVSSLPTSSISEAFAEVRDQITATAVQLRRHYQVIGTQTGMISILDTSKADKAPFQLWESPAHLSIGLLSWSCDGNYLACYELSGTVFVKRIRQIKDRQLDTSRVFEKKLTICSEGLEQILLNHDGSMLLVKNGVKVTIFHTAKDTNSATSAEVSITSPGTKWAKHPEVPSLLLVCNPSKISICQWKDLLEIASFDFSSPVGLVTSPNDDQEGQFPDRFSVNRIVTSHSGSSVLINTTDHTKGLKHHISLFDISITTRHTPPSATINNHDLPKEIREQIEIPLAILPLQGFVFLDKNYFMCSYRIGANPPTETVHRYYPLPKDWLNMECLELCAMLEDGTFLIPNNGELAVINCAAIR